MLLRPLRIVVVSYIQYFGHFLSERVNKIGHEASIMASATPFCFCAMQKPSNY